MAGPEMCPYSGDLKKSGLSPKAWGVSGGGWHGFVRPCCCGVALHLAAQQLLVWAEPQVLGVCAASRMRYLCLASEYGWAVAREKHKRRLKKKKKKEGNIHRRQ